MADVIICECGLGAERADIFASFGFRLTTTCPRCGAVLATRMSLDDLPGIRVDWERSHPDAIAMGEPLTITTERYEGVAIDRHTPLWSLYGPNATRTYQQPKEGEPT